MYDSNPSQEDNDEKKQRKRGKTKKTEERESLAIAMDDDSLWAIL